MNGLTDYITERPWVDTITTWYVLVDEAYQRLIARRGQRLRGSGPEPSFSDSEVITVALIIETFFLGHEELGYAFVAQYLRDCFPQLLDLDHFNVRRRALIAVMEVVRRDLRDQKLDRDDPLRLVDSAPIPLMTYTRGKRSQSVMGQAYFGVAASKQLKIFGLRLHATVTAEQLIDEWLLAPAAVHDGKVLLALLEDSQALTVIGDKAYVDGDQEDYLWQTRRIQLLPLRHRNQKNCWPKEVRRLLGGVRHRIETVFSTLTTVFNVQRPHGRSLAGHVVRIATCILAHTLSFFMS